jgi:uncharacterized damage-inducible protein DinB
LRGAALAAFSREFVVGIEARALLSHFHRQRDWTRSLVGALPEELFDWVPEGAGFSCGGLIRHLMQAEVFWARLLGAAVAGEAYDPFGMDGSPAQRVEQFRESNVNASRSDRLGTTFGECLEAWEGLQNKTEALIGSLASRDLEAISAVHPLTGLEAPLWEMVLVMIEHEAHHRGQLSAYMKARGIDHPSTLWS